MPLFMVDTSWAVRAHEPVTSPVTPTISPHADGDMLDLLRGRQFDVLDRRLNTMQRDYEKDTWFEMDMYNEFNQFDMADPEMEDLFREWLDTYPDSYAAHLAAGIFYTGMATEWRGGKYISETHPQRLEHMGQYLEKANAHLEKSIGMTRKPTASYAKLIRTARYYGDFETANKWLKEAISRDPYCLKPRYIFAGNLLPRWGGSYKAMREFAEDTRKGRHPKLERAALALEARMYYDMGYQEYIDGNYAAALDKFQKAISLKDESWYRVTRARLYKYVGQTDMAISDLNRALEMDPHATDAFYARGIALLDKRQTDEAIKDLLTAADHGNLEAMNKLGFLYSNGEMGAPLDVEEGLKWWSKAAYFWDENACFSVGKTYERGLGVKMDKDAAIPYYQIAASQGYGPAINDLGLMTWYGQGTPADRDEAIRLWIVGAKKGIALSKHNLNFFLSPLERLALAFRHPKVFLDDKQIILMGAGLFLALAFVLVLIVFFVVRLSKAR